MGLMDQFVEELGHARVPADYKLRDYKLGSWVAVQRYLHGRDELSQERTHRLEELPGWSWDPLADSWSEHYDALKSYDERVGHARPPQSYIWEGLRLGQWVAVQRRSRETTSTERMALLEAIPGWSWDPHTDRWERAYAVLAEFASREGHARVHQDHVEGGVRLGGWVIDQRVRRDKLTTEQRHRLEALSGWIWDAREDRWQRKYELFNRFHRREGHALVPQGHMEDGNNLGSWVMEQRGNRATLSEERRALLDAIPGWVWDPHGEAWERGYTTLLRFVERERHARVPKDHTEGRIKLGGWVTEQRANRQKMPDERRRRLEAEAIPGWFWGTRSDYVWNQKLALLAKFAEREGHSRPTWDHVEGGVRLGGWVVEQRAERQNLSAERKAALEAVPGWSWTVSQDAWDEK